MKKTILLSALSTFFLAATGCSVHTEEGFCNEVCVGESCFLDCDGEKIPCGVDDMDCDGIFDVDEPLCNTSPELADTDGDGILDGDEDPDGDGFSNLDELAAGSDPADAGSTPETIAANDPQVNDPPANASDTDTDGDGIQDVDEPACNTSPELADTDGDGILDGDEDPDGDGYTNAEEIDAGSDPSDGMSIPGACGPGGCFDGWGRCGGNMDNTGNFNGGDVSIACASTRPGGAALPAFLLGALFLLLPRLRHR